MSANIAGTPNSHHASGPICDTGFQPVPAVSSGNNRQVPAFRRGTIPHTGWKPVSPAKLFMSECLDGVEPGGLDGGEHAEDEPDAGAEAERQGDGPRGYVGLFELRVGDLAEDHEDALAAQQADEPAQEAEHARL